MVVFLYHANTIAIIELYIQTHIFDNIFTKFPTRVIMICTHKAAFSNSFTVRIFALQVCSLPFYTSNYCIVVVCWGLIATKTWVMWELQLLLRYHAAFTTQPV